MPGARQPNLETIADPGNGATLNLRQNHILCKLATAGAETRTLPNPAFDGQLVTLYFETDGGDCVVTAAGTVNQTGNNTLTGADAGDHIRLEGVASEWRVVANDGWALSTV